jgi:hypothetical protein
MFKFRLHPLFDMEGDIGSPSVEGEAEASGTETASVPDPNGNTADDVAKQESFSKRLKESVAKERQAWEAEQAEKYKDYDLHKELSTYLSDLNGGVDLMTLKERVEMERLQERADELGIPPEMQRRLEQLEAKAAKADQLEQQQQQKDEWSKFETSLKQFCEGKEIDGNPVDHSELWKYMHENGTSSPEIAFKAMRHDALEKKLETAEKEGVKKFLQAKGSIPTVAGKTATGQTFSAAPKTFAEARQRAMLRMTSE